MNLIANCLWDYYVVNMALPRTQKKLDMEDSQHATNIEMMDGEYEPPTVSFKQRDGSGPDYNYNLIT